jgi:hypothetical protein
MEHRLVVIRRRQRRVRLHMISLKMAAKMTSLCEFPFTYLALVFFLSGVDYSMLLQRRGRVECLPTLTKVISLTIVSFNVDVKRASRDEPSMAYFTVVSGIMKKNLINVKMLYISSLLIAMNGLEPK